MLNHVTYQLSWEALAYTGLAEIMELIGFEEVEPTDPFEHGYEVRWFQPERPSLRSGRHAATVIHFVADGVAQDLALGLGHFCVAGLGVDRYTACCASDYCVRESGSGRAWLEYDGGRLRIEVRP
jgi:hypothetical protein